MEHKFEHEAVEVIVDYDEDGAGTEQVLVCPKCGAHEVLAANDPRRDKNLVGL